MVKEKIEQYTKEFQECKSQISQIEEQLVIFRNKQSELTNKAFMLKGAIEALSQLGEGVGEAIPQEPIGSVDLQKEESRCR